MKFHHIGYAVENIDKSIIRFEQLGFIQRNKVIDDELRDVLIIFLENNGVQVELIQPKSLESVLMPILKRYRDIPYHVAYEVKSLSKKTNELVKIGFKVIIKAEKAVAFSNNKVVFLYASNLGIIELIENPSLEDIDE